MMKTIRDFGSWIGRQADGFIGGVMRLASTPPKSWLPTGVWATLVWLFSTILWAFGSDNAVRQITSSFALFLFAILASWITLGATLVLAGLFAFLLGVGLLRLIPVVDKWFVEIRDALIPART